MASFGVKTGGTAGATAGGGFSFGNQNPTGKILSLSSLLHSSFPHSFLSHRIVSHHIAFRPALSRPTLP